METSKTKKQRVKSKAKEVVPESKQKQEIPDDERICKNIQEMKQVVSEEMSRQRSKSKRSVSMIPTPINSAQAVLENSQITQRLDTMLDPGKLSKKGVAVTTSHYDASGLRSKLAKHVAKQANKSAPKINKDKSDKALSSVPPRPITPAVSRQ